jgi:hypothetical protein
MIPFKATGDFGKHFRHGLRFYRQDDDGAIGYEVFITFGRRNPVFVSEKIPPINSRLEELNFFRGKKARLKNSGDQSLPHVSPSDDP